MKTLITTFLITATLLSCNHQASSSQQSAENEKIINKYFAHFNKHEWKEMAEMYAPVAEFKDPSFGTETVKQTREQIIEKYSGLSEIFPDVQDQIIRIYPSGENHIIVEFISTGTAPDGSAFELPICTVFTIENGLITKDFTYYDNFEEPNE